MRDGAPQVAAAAVQCISGDVEVFVGAPITVVVEPVAALQAVGGGRAIRLATRLGIVVGVEPPRLAPGEVTLAQLADRQPMGKLAGCVTSAAVVGVIEQIEALVDPAVAVVVGPVAHLGAWLRGGTGILAAGARILIGIHEAGWTAHDDTHSALAGRLDASAPTCAVARAAVRQAAEVKALIHGPIAVIVHLVAPLDAIGRGRADRLAPIGHAAIGIGEARSAAFNQARAVETPRFSVGQPTQVGVVELPAPTAVVHVALLVEALVHLAIAVVVALVAHIVAGGLAARLATVLRAAVSIHKTRLAGHQLTQAVNTHAGAMGICAPDPAPAAVLAVLQEGKAVVHQAVAVIVFAITDLGPRRHRCAGCLTPGLGAAVGVGEARLAPGKRTLTRLTARIPIEEEARVATDAAVFDIARHIEGLVHPPITVVIQAVAALCTGTCGAGGLAAGVCAAVRIHEASLTGRQPTDACLTHRLAARIGAADAARAAVQWAADEVEVLIDQPIAVVVGLVTQLHPAGRRCIDPGCIRPTIAADQAEPGQQAEGQDPASPAIGEQQQPQPADPTT